MFPAASCIASALAAALAALLVWLVTRRMIATVINRRLRCRLRTFQISLIAGAHDVGSHVPIRVVEELNVIWMI